MRKKKFTQILHREVYGDNYVVDNDCPKPNSVIKFDASTMVIMAQSDYDGNRVYDEITLYDTVNGNMVTLNNECLKKLLDVPEIRKLMVVLDI